jgi:integrase
VRKQPRASDNAISCGVCCAWGVAYSGQLCRPCFEFEGRYPTVAECGACARRLPLRQGHCRPCWYQAHLDRPVGMRHTVLLPYVRRVRHHQLFFAGMPTPRDITTRPPRRVGVGTGAPGVRRLTAPPPAIRPSGAWVQLLLFEDLRRDYRYGTVDLRCQQLPANPWLAWALHLAHGRAEARGWSDTVRRALNRNLVMLLARYVEGEVIRYSAYHRVLTARGSSLAHTTEVLQTLGVLLDDRHPSFDVWVQDKLEDLAPAIRDDTHRWVRVMHDGGPRTRARHPRTVRGYVALLRPVLQQWSSRHDHLREITHDEVISSLTTLRGHPRQTTLVALRSLFAWAKRTGIVFANPTSRIPVGQIEPGVLQPLTSEQIARTTAAATTPQARVFVVLAAVHAARPGAVRALQLTDVDLGNRRLTVAGRTRPLDELTYQVLLGWLAHRRQRWPRTANPHLVINTMTAVGARSVSHVWANRTLQGLPATFERLRIDRQLEEALICGPDPLHLAEVFGLDPKTAIRYASSARDLLERPHEATSVGSSRTHERAPRDRVDPPVGSS